MPSTSPKTWFDFDMCLCAGLIFLQPFTNLAIKYGDLRIDPARVLSLLCMARLVYILLLRSSRETFSSSVFKRFGIVFLVVVYAFCMTLLQPAFTSDLGFVSVEEANGFILRRGVKYLQFLALAIYLALILREPRKIHLAMVSLAAGLSLLEVLGLLQSIVFTASGIDLFPIKRIVEANGEIQYLDLSVPVTIFGMRFLRVNSLASEPKVFALFLNFLFVVKFYWLSYRNVFGFRLPRWLDVYMTKTIWLTALMILSTFSGGGIIVFISGLVLIILFGLKKQRGMINPLNSSLKSLLVSSLVILPPLLFLSINSDRLPEAVSAILDNSLFRRTGALESSISVDAFYKTLDPEDGAIIYNIINNPSVLFHGLGFGGFSSLSLIFFKLNFSSYSSSPFSRNIGIEIIFSVGMVGIVGLLLFFRRINFLYTNGQSVLSPIYPILNIIIILNVLIRSSETLFFICLGLLVGVSLCDQHLLSFYRNSNSGA
ncbi:hypothetical protein [Leptothoe sp. PORK10 BA2]|uniref:hypothetical protein n=1 Tax=Leptothoe sp. PORK10 BA2 TaxID=3110254 RepID=UPI002B21D3DA|nr:hypothetical protein [Leptothoe sp. PORK10 BA2]MEA5466503.1 hypothetical protein [Leptothoe sp. PORK10 BA2]